MAMLEVLALLLCDHGTVDPQGKVTLHGLFDTLQAPTVPIHHPRLTVFWKCHFPAPGEVWIEITGPDRALMMVTPRKRIDRAGMAQEVHDLTALTFPTGGTYHVRLLTSAGPVAETPLVVALQQ